MSESPRLREVPKHPDDLGGSSNERILLKTTIYKHKNQKEYLKYWLEILRSCPINLTCVDSSGFSKHSKGKLVLFINGETFSLDVPPEVFSAVPKQTESDVYELSYGTNCVVLHVPHCFCNASGKKRCTHTLLVLGKGDFKFGELGVAYKCSGFCKSPPAIGVQLGLLRRTEVIKFTLAGHTRYSRFNKERICKSGLMSKETQGTFKQWKLDTFDGVEKKGVFFHAFSVPTPLREKRKREDYVALHDKKRKMEENKQLTLKNFSDFIDGEDQDEDGVGAELCERMDLLLVFAKELYQDPGFGEGEEQFKELAKIENVELLRARIMKIRSRKALVKAKLLAEENIVKLLVNSKPELVREQLGLSNC